MLHKADFFKGDSVGEPLAQIYFGSHVLWNQTWFYLWGKLNYRLCSAMILILTLSYYTVLKWIKLKWLCGVNFKPTSSIFLFLYTHIYTYIPFIIIVLLFYYHCRYYCFFATFYFDEADPKKKKKDTWEQMKSSIRGEVMKRLSTTLCLRSFGQDWDTY